MAGGVREEGKRHTRARIADVALALFAKRGFEAVSVAEIARAAGVTEKTVFNHFSTKESLVYSADHAFEEQLVGTVRGRSPDESVCAAAARFLLGRYAGFVGDPARQSRHQTLARLLTDSPALQARERLILSRYATVLQGEIAAELGGDEHDLRPQVAAQALIAAHASVIAAFRRAVLEGRPADEFAPRVIASARQAFDMLAHGVGSAHVRVDAGGDARAP